MVALATAFIERTSAVIRRSNGAAFSSPVNDCVDVSERVAFAMTATRLPPSAITRHSSTR